MLAFKRALMAIDLSELDLQLLHFIKRHHRALGIQKLYALHIMPDFTDPAHPEVDFQKRFAPESPVDERVKSAIQARVGEVFGEAPELEIEIEVREGKPYEKLLHWTKIKEVDLLIMGKKRLSEGSGITAKRVARNVHAAVLFVPDGAGTEITNLVVPNDFSENAARALKVALKLSRAMKGQPVHSLHIVDLPPGQYYNRSAPDRGYLGMLKESAHLAAGKFREAHGIADDDIVDVYQENSRNNLAAHVLRYASDHKEVLLVMGAKGHTPFETFLFGSVTERIAQGVEGQPLLIVR
ncbi:MAG: universal stress protein [Phaeodactylibacter sp.]|uniref:universal stress protein n=1 Tax=Phaeodactylibacter sp. TaxID=1940289 RepID=UPI0032ED1AC5